MTVLDRPPPSSGPLRLTDFPEREHLAGAGNWLWKLPWGDGHAVLKVYFGSRHPLLHVRKTLSHLLITSRSSHMPRARCRTERDCLAVWSEHGFDVFGHHPEVRFEDLPRDGYLLFDFVEGVHFRELFADEAVPLEERMAIWRRFLVEWHRRHATAIATSDPRLIHENGDVKHVLLVGERFVSFDFEVVYRSRDVRDLVGRELLAYLRSCGKFFGEAIYQRMLDETVAHYPDPTLLRAAWEHAWRHPRTVMRVARKLDRALRPRKRKRFSKSSVAAELGARLDAAGKG